jgi:anti-sigma regulatory factor (Ser/Thr protein kinase)
MINSLQAQHWINISHASDIAAVRRLGSRMAQRLGFDEVRCGELSIILTEAATNILKHAGEGRIYLSEAHHGHCTGINALVMDNGPGIPNLAQAMHDGVSSTGTAGTGLGAMRRLADEFDIYAPRDRGTICALRLWNGPAPQGVLAADAVCLPLAGEEENGDAVALIAVERGIAMVSVDGLGHGPDAALASGAALHRFAQQPSMRVAAQVEACHAALRPTRGAALAVAFIDTDRDQLTFAGVGNIGAYLINGIQRRSLVSSNGIVGHNMRKVQELVFPIAKGDLVILHSDGIGTQWDLAQYPGLLQCSPALIAGVLLRDHARARDDASVLVLRYEGHA